MYRSAQVKVVLACTGEAAKVPLGGYNSIAVQPNSTTQVTRRRSGVARE